MDQNALSCCPRATPQARLRRFGQFQKLCSRKVTCRILHSTRLLPARQSFSSILHGAPQRKMYACGGEQPRNLDLDRQTRIQRPARAIVVAPDRCLTQIRGQVLVCIHGVYAPLHREASDTLRKIEHLVPVYMLTRSLLAEPIDNV